MAVARVSSVLGWTKAAHQASASSFWTAAFGRLGELLGLRCWWMCRSSRLSGSVRVIVGRALGQDRFVTGMPDWAEQVVLALRVRRVLLLQGRADLAVVAFDRGEGRVGQAFGEQRGSDAEEGVADADVLVQVRQRLAGLQGFHPERDLRQLCGHGLMSTP